jgi:4-carboxymuconolactone decarboxylase
MQSLTNREQLFVALGAAIGSNCVPCVESIIPKAKGAGIEDWELRLAVNSADFVRQKPAADLTVGACPLDQMEGPPASQVTETTQSDSRCCG